MTDRPSLSNGYLWVYNAVMSAARAQRIKEGIRDLRCELRTQDVSAMGYPQAATVVELWIHPEDDKHVLGLLRSLSVAL